MDRYDERVFEECILSEEWAREYLIELLSNYSEDYDQNKKENLGALLKWYENNFGIDQLFDGAFFNLANALSGQLAAGTDFIQCIFVRLVDSVKEAQDFLLFFGQGG